MTDAYIAGRNLIASFQTIERCKQAIANIERNGHPHKEDMLNLIDARMKVLDFDAGRPFGFSTGTT